jgi:hypothetical protein
MIRIAQHLLLLLVAVSTANAAFLYFGEGFFGVRGNLYVLDTTTNRVSVVGTVRDADGNTYGTNAMHYMSSTGLIMPSLLDARLIARRNRPSLPSILPPPRVRFLPKMSFIILEFIFSMNAFILQSYYCASTSVNIFF